MNSMDSIYKKKRNVPAGHLLALFSVFVWGTTFIATKLLLKSFEPVDILFYRFLIGYAMLWVLYPRPLKLARPKEELLFLLAGASGVSVYFLCENFALTYTYASNVSILVATAPFITGLLAHFISKEKLNRFFIIGFFLSIAGIVLITTNGNLTLHLNPLGDLLALFAAVCWAVYSLTTVMLHKPSYSSVAVTRRIFFYGLLTIIPFLAFRGFHFDVAALLAPSSIGLFLFLGLVASGLCYITWNKALELLGAVRASVYIYLVPVVTVIFSFFILDERLTFLSLFGCVLIIIGLLLSGKH